MIGEKEKLILREKLSAPLSDLRALSINVKALFTDVNGTIIDKNILPANLKVKLPLFLLSEFDRIGGYYAGLRIVPVAQNSWQLLSSLIWGGDGMPFPFGFPGLNDIQGQINSGDIVTIWTDSLTVPTYYAFVIQGIDGASLGSILANTKTTQRDKNLGELYIQKCQYFSDNEPNWFQPMNIIEIDNLGNFRKDGLQPNSFRKIYQTENVFVEFNLEFFISQYVGLYTYLLFTTNNLQFNFVLQVQNSFTIKK